MKKTLSAVAICVGTMIGAGYASGQEVAAYFGTAPSFLVPVSCGIMMFILIAVLLGVAARTRGSTKEVNRAVFGRASVVADGAMTVNAVIVLSAMMAGAEMPVGGGANEENLRIEPTLLTGVTVSFFNEKMRLRRNESFIEFDHGMERLTELSPDQLARLEEQYRAFRGR